MGQIKQVLINGKAFSASDISVSIAGIEVAAISALTAKVAQEKTNNKGFSDEPVSRGRATKVYECSIDLSYTEALKLRNISPTQGLLEVPPFEILVVLDNAVNVSRIRIRNAEFTDDGIEVTAEDPEVKMTYTLIIAGMDFI
jgi:hypothetical protein